MPPYPGEERLVTVFADIHYYFAQPTRKPLLHRFDKGSYFYIYYNATRQTSRIEVANNPGTPDQDAFNGYIDNCRIVNSYRFPTQMTIEVDAVPTSPSSPKSGREEWCLSSADLRDPNNTKYKLHTIDFYFWAAEDARLVIECFKRLLPASQLDVAELEPEDDHVPQLEQAQPPNKPANAASSVVQNLENLAVSDDYHQSSLQRSQRDASPSSSFLNHSVPPPPQGGSGGQLIRSPSPAISDLSSRRDTPATHQTSAAPASFVPVAYNPAAPAAPEPIAHREKTPPPEDGDHSSGLAAAVQRDQGYVPGGSQYRQQQPGGYQIGQGPPNTFGGGYASPPPQNAGYGSPAPAGQPSSFKGPPQPSQDHYGSPPPPAHYGQQDPHTAVASPAPSFGPGAASTIQQDQRHSSAAETYVPQRPAQPTQTPSNQFYESLQQTRPEKPLSHVQPQYPDYLSQATSAQSPPTGGYSQYQYGSSSQASQNPYDIHSQVYRPTEIEANTHHGHYKKPSKSSNEKKDDPNPVKKVEKGVGKLFKRIEKRIG